MTQERKTVGTIEAWQDTLRSYVLRTGVAEVARAVGVKRDTVYKWIRPNDPALPKDAEVRNHLEHLMGIRRRRAG